SQFNRFTFPNRHELPHLFGITERYDLKWGWSTHFAFTEKRPKCHAHLLKTQSGLAATFLTGVGDYRKVRRAHLNPLSICCEGRVCTTNNYKQKAKPCATTHSCTLAAYPTPLQQNLRAVACV